MRRALGALLAPLGLAACGAADAHVADRVDSAGIEIVTSSAEDLPAPWRLVEVGRFGGDPDDTMIVSSIERLRLTASPEQFFILDTRASRVVAVDTLGQYIGSFGRAGDGPGELRYPSGISVSADTVTIVDLERARLVSYSPAGKLLSDTPVPEQHRSSFRLGHFGRQLIMDRRDQDSTWFTVEVVIVSQGDSGVLGRQRSPLPGSAELHACGMQVVMRAVPLFAPRLNWSSAGDWLAVVNSADYDVTVHHAGNPSRRLRRAIPPREATESLARQQIGDTWKLGIDDRDCEVAPDEVIKQMGVAERVPAIQDVMIDANGWLWVQRYAVGDEPVFVDLFNPDGEYAGTLRGENSMPDAAAGDYVASAIEDSLGLPAIVVSRIEGRDG